MKNKIKIAFIIPSLRPAGAERIMSFVAQNINTDSFDSTLIVTGSKTENDYSDITCKLVYLNSNRVFTSIPKLYKYLKKNRQDIVVSSIIHLNIVVGFLSNFFSKTKFIARESSVISKNNVEKDIKNRISSLLVNKTYRNFDNIICQSKDMKTDLKESFGIKENQMHIINNPITKPFESSLEKKQTPNKLNLITIGRLSSVKGYDRLLRILSKVNFDFNYTIIGNGNTETLLSDLEKYNLTDKITHIPFSSNVYEFLKKSDLYLQGSYVEGFPNALLESCVTGTPAIAFNVPGGTKEIIDNGINGYLAEDEEEFLSLLNNFKQADFDPEKVSDNVVKKFNREKIIKQYESLFYDSVKR